MSKSHGHHNHDSVELSSQLLPHTTIIHHRSKNVFILKSLSIIVTLTVVVLGINYYLISNCPSSETSSSPQQQHQEETQFKLKSGVETTLEAVRVAPVVISVYYEILCPDSKSFILRQLVPVEKKYKSLVQIKYIPFGKASFRTEQHDYQFSCQHGKEECHGNKLHSCVLELFPGDTKMQTAIIGCSMERYRLWGTTIEEVSSVTQECREKHAPNLSPSTPLLCNNASALLAGHGRETLSLNPAVSFIPTIAIDGSLSNQRQILRDLDTMVCKSLRQRPGFSASSTDLNLNC